MKIEFNVSRKVVEHLGRKVTLRLMSTKKVVNVDTKMEGINVDIRGQRPPAGLGKGIVRLG